MKRIQKITIVGGGTAGLVAALILNVRFPLTVINIVRSKKIGIIGVGEGSTEHWNAFMNYVGLDYQQIIRECDATFKCGIMFKDWGVNDYMHSVGAEKQEIVNGLTKVIYSKLISLQVNNDHMNPIFSWENKLPISLLDNNNPPFNQYHFNTFKLNSLLEKIASSRGINLYDDEIINVNLDESGINNLIGEKQNYYADFYIDCTGFAKLLIGKLETKWKSLSKYLTMKAAITFQTADTEEYNIYTLAKGMNSGWMFRIPVWGRHGNGYIYDSDFCSKEHALDEIRSLMGENFEIGREFKFDPGYLNKVWVKNCCAVGLSSSFFEPLEATSIGSTIQQIFMLIHRLPNYDEHIIKKYNRDVEGLFENIRDFIFLHYMGKRNDTQFWRHVSSIKPPDSLNEFLNLWKHRLPIDEDFVNTTGYRMFNDHNYIQILYGLRLFHISSIKQEYDMMSPTIKNSVELSIKNFNTKKMFMRSIGHKEFIKIIRDRYDYLTLC